MRGRNAAIQARAGKSSRNEREETPLTTRISARCRGLLRSGRVSGALIALGWLIVSAGSPTVVQASAKNDGPCGRSYDTGVQYPYAIHATWMFARETGCEWQRDLEAFHRIGGQAVLQFGSALERLRKTPSGLLRASDATPVLQGCRHDDGTPCAEQVEVDLENRGIPSERIANWLFYESFEPHSDAIVCPGRETLGRRIEYRRAGEVRTAWRVVLPHDDASHACDYRSGRLDILFVAQQPGAAGQKSFMQVAEALDMEVYLGAPAFPVEAAAAWKPDYELAPALLDWSRRVFADLARRYSDYSSYRGVYQTFEVPLMPAWRGDGYDLYTRQARRLHEIDADADYVVSPYLYVNKSQGGTDVAGTVKGFARLARGGIDIIVPQDGRGTGKAALFWPWEKDQQVASVDPQLGNYTNVEANASFEAQFYASSEQLFAALRRTAVELKESEGVDVRLWPNIEAFDEDRDDPGYVGCAYSDLSQTTKARVDRAITFAGPARRVASFMFDPLFRCSDRYESTLLSAIMADYDRPIVTGASIVGSDGVELAVRGYHLAGEGTRFEVTWHEGSAAPRRLLTTVVSRRSPGAGPAPDTVWLRFPDASPRGGRVAVAAIAADGRRAHAALGLATGLPAMARVD